MMTVRPGWGDRRVCLQSTPDFRQWSGPELLFQPDALDGERVEVPVTGGHVKMQWKPDWALRWAALGVDYEMSGKDLIDSVRLSGRITKALGAPPPEG